MLWLLEQMEALEPEAVLALLPTLSEPRRLRVEAMGSLDAQVRAILAERLLCHALRAEYGLAALPPIALIEGGKPCFPDHPELHFNLSHCKTAVACALDTAPLGVDVQEYRPVYLKGPLPSAPPVYRILSPEERGWVAAGETPEAQTRRFTALWTCKEAYGKALGLGLRYDLAQTSFLPAPGLWTQYGFTFRHWQAPAWACTLCAQGPLDSNLQSAKDFIVWR